jgi:hypothetical protein
MYLVLLVCQGHILSSIHAEYHPEIKFTDLVNSIVWSFTGKVDHYRNVMNLAPEVALQDKVVRDKYQYSDSYVAPITKLSHSFSSPWGDFYLYHTAH